MAKTKTSKSSVIEHTFPDGSKFSGSIEQLTAVASALGLKLVGVSSTPRGYYPSESKGMVPITSMNDYHIRRALIKRCKDYMADIYKAEDTNRVFLKKFSGMNDDTVIVDLYNELTKR
jgi:hypothetical protein